MHLRWLHTLPGAKAKQEGCFCQESQNPKPKGTPGQHLAPPPHANSCKRSGLLREGGPLRVTAEPR